MQFTSPNLYEDFDYTERFPSRDEVLRYFRHLDEKLDLSKDIQFNTTVESAKFHPDDNKWLINCSNTQTNANSKVSAKYFILCTGSAWKLHVPKIPGLDKFKGTVYHTSRWEGEQNASQFGSKQIAVIGTGASGVQVVQELGHKLNTDGKLVVYQRTPNLALPMKQCLVQGSTNLPKKSDFPAIYKETRNNYAGIDYDSIPRNALDDNQEERRALYEKLWSKGGFPFWVGSYQDVLFNKDANATAYQFWAEKTRERIQDERKKDILAPLVPPHAFGTKRPSLEQNYYEVFNKDNVDVVDIRKDPILEITKNGIRTENGGETEFDVIVFATGFDGITGNKSKLVNIDKDKKPCGFYYVCTST